MVRLLIMVNGKMGLQGKRQSIFENVQNQIFEKQNEIHHSSILS